MSEHTFDELSKKTVAQLREIAESLDDEAVHGYKTMHKEQLVKALCEGLHIDAHVHHQASGIDKPAIKARIRLLKVKRDEALQSHDSAALKRIRHDMKRLKHKIRSHTV